MGWPMAVAAIVSIAGSALSARSASGQARNQRAWQQYNATMKRNSDMATLQAQSLLMSANAQAAMIAGNTEAMLIQADTNFNRKLIEATTQYNNLLLEEEIDQVWEASELDIMLLKAARDQERGAIEAQQSASGTVMNEGSNAQVLIGQKTQEELDAFVVQRNANMAVADLQNSIAQNTWQGGLQVKKLMWEGNLSAFGAKSNASLRAGQMAIESRIGALVGQNNISQEFTTGLSNAQMNYRATQSQIANNFRSSVFSTASSYIASYYGNKPTVGGDYTPLTMDQNQQQYQGILRTGTWT